MLGAGLKAHARYRFEAQPWLYAFGEAKAYRTWGGQLDAQGVIGIGGTF